MTKKKLHGKNRLKKFIESKIEFESEGGLRMDR